MQKMCQIRLIRGPLFCLKCLNWLGGMREDKLQLFGWYCALKQVAANWRQNKTLAANLSDFSLHFMWQFSQIQN